MRLICPKCSAQYEIDDSLVPAGGREVECSGCGHVWFQPGRMAGADQAPAQLSRPLNESILSVLREEAARELNARKAGQEPPPASEAPIPESPVPATPPQMPPQPVATPPLTSPAAPPNSAAPASAAPEDADRATASRENFRFDWAALRDSAPPARPATELPDASALAATLVHESARQIPVAALPANASEDAETHTPPPARTGYRRGLFTGLLVVAVLTGLYSAAPALADKGAFGAKLMEWRELAGRGHDWIYARLRPQD